MEGGTYHVYSRGNDGMSLFLGPEDYRAYLAILKELATPNGVVLFHYALMPNHIHLLLRPRGSAELSAYMRGVQYRFTKHFSRKTGFQGHVWQGRFKHRDIDTDAYLFACGNYIEMNPVRAGLVRDPADWPYTSYHVYAHGRQDDLVTLDPFYPSLGSDPTARQSVYRRLITQTRA